jgi:hypothetical protein
MNFVSELKRRNVYKVAVAGQTAKGVSYGSLKSAPVLVRFDHVASGIVNANHGIAPMKSRRRLSNSNQRYQRPAVGCIAWSGLPCAMHQWLCRHKMN